MPAICSGQAPRWDGSGTAGNTWTVPVQPAHDSQKGGRDAPHLTCKGTGLSAGSVPRAQLLRSPGAGSVALQENLLARPRRLLSLPKVSLMVPVFSFCSPVCYSFIQVYTQTSKAMSKVLQQPFQTLQKIQIKFVGLEKVPVNFSANSSFCLCIMFVLKSTFSKRQQPSQHLCQVQPSYTCGLGLTVHQRHSDKDLML